MTDKKNKTNADSPFRTPKPKKKLGLKVPVIRMPHEDLIKPEFPKLEVVEKTEDTLSSVTRQSTPSSHTRHTRQSEIAPTKNFQKVPNSITKSAIPEGLFKQGKSKHLYDVLYSLTRGAIEPKRSIRLSKTKLRKLAGIGSRVTFDSCVSHLENVGLLKITIYIGEHEGNNFEVFLPDEVTRTSVTSLPSLSSHTSPTQKADTLDSPENRQTSHSTEVINTSTRDNAKTSFKTLKYIDDEAPVINVLEKLNETARKLTGKDLTKKDIEKLSDLVEILINETVIAAARTGSVSATVSFMTENLRRRLYSKPRSTAKKENSRKDLYVGKGTEDQSEEESTLAAQTPLSEEQRENTLIALREAKATDTIFFREFTTYGEIEYTPEDYNWLMEKLEQGS